MGIKYATPQADICVALCVIALKRATGKGLRVSCATCTRVTLFSTLIYIYYILYIIFI